MPARRPTKSTPPAAEPQGAAPAKTRPARKAAASRQRAKAVKPAAPSAEASPVTAVPAPTPVAKRRRARRARPAAPKATAPAAKPQARQKRAAPQSALAKALAAQIKERGLSLAAAARAIGVNPVGLRRTLSKNSTPNARTAKRYQRWLRSAAPAASAPAARSGLEGGSAVLSPSALRLTLGDLLRAAAAPAAPAEPQLAKADRALLADDLARRVHAASASTRRLVGTVLATLRA